MLSNSGFPTGSASSTYVDQPSPRHGSSSVARCQSCGLMPASAVSGLRAWQPDPTVAESVVERSQRGVPADEDDGLSFPGVDVATHAGRIGGHARQGQPDRIGTILQEARYRTDGNVALDDVALDDRGVARTDVVRNPRSARMRLGRRRRSSRPRHRALAGTRPTRSSSLNQGRGRTSNRTPDSSDPRTCEDGVTNPLDVDAGGMASLSDVPQAATRRAIATAVANRIVFALRSRAIRGDATATASTASSPFPADPPITELVGPARHVYASACRSPGNGLGRYRKRGRWHRLDRRAARAPAWSPRVGRVDGRCRRSGGAPASGCVRSCVRRGP